MAIAIAWAVSVIVVSLFGDTDDKDDDTGDDDTDNTYNSHGQVSIDSDGKPKCRLGVGFLQVEKSYTDEVQKWFSVLLQKASMTLSLKIWHPFLGHVACTPSLVHL